MLKGRECVAVASGAAGSGGPAPAGLGEACAVDADCTTEPYQSCITRNASSGYCSRTGCTDECDPGYFCATDASPAYCKRTPTGQGDVCTANADCVGNDATHCALDPATGRSSCVVRDCTQGGCSPAFSDCLDLSMFEAGAPKICIPAS